MTRHIRRVGRAALVSLTAVAVVLVGGSCAPRNQDSRADYCAILPDTVGLYEQNLVTQMGVRIGEVRAIKPGMDSVRVDFTVHDRPLPANVKAVIRSPSILADRSLELVGNYDAGARLQAGSCIPLNRSFTPKSLSAVIGSATDFINAVNPQDSTNIGDVLKGVDQSVLNQGAGVNALLSTTSRVLDSPDQAIGDIGSITKNMAVLTSTLREIEPAIKQILTDGQLIAEDLGDIGDALSPALEGLPPLIAIVADLERELGPEIQQLLDIVSVVVRKISGRAPYYASLLNVAPRLINGAANFLQTRGNSGAAAFTIRYRPPLYRVRTPNGAFQCGYMNAAMPGSCANVNGTPYAVDVALLQYVMTQAATR